MSKIKANKIIKKIFSPNDSIREKFFSGVVWVYMLEVSQKALRMLQLIILARFLDPKSFGIVGFAVIIVNAANAFSETGIKKAVIQRDAVNRKALDTAWSMSLLRGVIIFTIMFFLAPFISSFFSSPRLIPVIRVIAINFILMGSENIGLILLTKDLDFKKVGWWEFWGFISNFIVSISLAFYLKNEWAIVIGIVTANFVKMLLSYQFHEYRPKLKFDIPVAKDFFDYGKWIGGAKISNFLSEQLDKLVLAKLLGMYELGIYTVSYQLAEFSNRIINQMRRFVFPTMSQLKNKQERISEAYLLYVNIVALVFIPILGCLFVMADEFVYIFLGKKWMLTVVPLKILALGMSFRVLTTSSFPLLNAIGKSKTVFYVTFVRNIALASMIYPLGKFYGINGIALSYSISAVIGFPICLLLVIRNAQIKLNEFKILLFPVTGTIVIITSITFLKALFESNSIILFTFEVFVAVLIYISCGLAIDRILKINVFERLMFVKKMLYSNT